MNNDNTTTQQELIGLNAQIGEWEKGRETKRLKAVLADDLYFRRASGKVVNKETYLADLVSPDNTYEYLISEDVEATVYEDTAVVSLRVRAKGNRQGTGFEGTYRNTRLFLKRPEGWQCVVWFNTRIEQP